MDFNKIKLIIWDLDETLWKGTLSEESVALSDENKNLIIKLTDIGIVNSICSKNNETQVNDELEKYGIKEYFVFSSIDWTPKGNRIAKIITDMQLRAQNVLFIDDNHSNIEEAKYFSPQLLTATPSIIPELISWVNDKTPSDLSHKRLNQYKILEEKAVDKLNYNSNEEFLASSHIKLEIHSDCLQNVERIHDLVMRSNQLNFTKKRDSVDTLKNIFNNSAYKCGYVSVKDDFGDYGIVGFFAIKDNVCEHFLFSCRTLGMGIEQYTYNYLQRPKLDIVGDVVSDLSKNKLPFWINQSVESFEKKGAEIKNGREHEVLIKGPCDLFQIFPFIEKSDCIDTEFTYVLDNGAAVESTAHTTHIAEANILTDKQKQLIVSELPFMDLGAYNNNIYKLPYKVVVLSYLQDCNLGVYQRKGTGERVAFIEYTSDMTNPDNYEKLINKKCSTAGFNFTDDFLKFFSEKYEFIGRNTPYIILENYKYIRSHLNPNTVMAIMLGVETPYDMGDNLAYKDRHIVHKQVNDLLRSWANKTKNVKLIDVNKYVKSSADFYDHINHFTKPVYYNLAKDIVEIINNNTEHSVKEYGRWKIAYMKFHDFIGNLLAKIR